MCRSSKLNQVKRNKWHTPRINQVRGKKIKMADNDPNIVVAANKIRKKMIVLGFNDTSTLVGHFMSSPREREKRDSRGDDREEQGRKRNSNESEEIEETKTFPL